ncbi:MAG: sulfur carrier protein ThiS [Lachnospiraceae bacterium]|mgnify:CR=1 FL=1|nr:sulfur carrier protein ThiS [Lachnospiraceae bacterium]MEE1341144.1 sulfur carrier protein ThiS [Lachnospiraceae bacterium]
MQVNGKQITVKTPITLKEFLLDQDYTLSHIAVEINEAIIPKEAYETTQLKESDIIEIVNFVGGGSGLEDQDPLIIKDHKFHSRFILGSGKFSLEMTKKVIENAGVEMATLALRRANVGGEENILDYMPSNVTLLPNTSGARNASEAVRIAHLARELGCGDFVKLEIIHDSKYLMPDNYETIKATEILAKEGFIVMPYMYPDLNVARELENVGAAAVMPLGAPIGSNKGLLTKPFIEMLVEEISLPIIVDAGIGRPSQACEAMELGVAAVMANTSIATARDVAQMATAFKLAVEAGRHAYLAGLGRVLEKRGEASSPLTGFLND